MKPMIIFGQDECIFKQFLMTKKTWIGPNGEKNLVPKDEGLGRMISAFVSREFGFGLAVTPEQLNEINAKRLNTQYKDVKAANEAGGCTDGFKKPLTESPFVRQFEYGANSDGYWSYNHMVLQLEDCVDVLNHLYGSDYDYLFLFDHSSGHDKQQENGLNANKMTKNYGGAQRAMRSTHIAQEQGYLGPFSRTLRVGDIQHMVFQEYEAGPFWMNAEEREAKRHDKVKEGTTSTRTLRLEELKILLQEKGLLARGKKTELIKRCEDNGIRTIETTQKIGVARETKRATSNLVGTRMDRCQQLGQLHNEWKTKCQWSPDEEHQPKATDGQLHRLRGRGIAPSILRTRPWCHR
jgi:hypothetical protein